MTQRSADFDVRSALVHAFLAAGVPRRDIRHEITLDTSSSDGRADIVLLRDQEVVGIEIKSGSDNLDRIQDQRRGYQLAFDRVQFLVDKRHVESMHRAGFYGFSVFDQQTGISLYDLQQFLGKHWCGPSGGNASARHMARLLWRDEAVAFMGGRTRDGAIKRIGETMCLRDLRPKVIGALRSRVLNRWEETFWKRFDAPTQVAA